MIIDWSKAPEGANGYVPHDEAGPAPALWYRRDGQKLEWKPADAPGDWMPSVHARDGIIWRDEQQATWSGEGLPPVGTVCEVWDGAARIWGKVEVVFISDLTVVVRFPCGNCFAEWARDVRDTDFRPIRTPEQIAAEEREAAIAEIFEVLTGSRDQAAWSRTCYSAHAANLYDAGYRKVEGGDA